LKAAILKNKYELSIENVHIPEIKNDEVLVKVSFVGICGTDIEMYEKKTFFNFDFPIIIGHEWSGVIEKVGECVKDFKAGDKVVGDCHIGCGKCRTCISGYYENCDEGIIGVGCSNLWGGALREYINMPARHVYKIPEKLSLIEAAMVEPSVIASYSVDVVGICKGDIVLVTGTGAIGFFAAQYAKYCGAGKVILIGRNDIKLSLAKKMAIDETINLKTQDLFKEIGKLTNSKGVNVSIETSGNINALYDVFKLTGKFGRISIVGCYTENLTNINIGDFISKDLLIKFIGSTGGGKNFKRMLYFLSEKIIKGKELITSIYDFNDIEVAFKEKLTQTNNIKTIIQIN